MTEKECLAAGIAVSLFAHFALLIAPRPPKPEPSFTTVVQMDMASPAVATSRENGHRHTPPPARATWTRPMPPTASGRPSCATSMTSTRPCTPGVWTAAKPGSSALPNICSPSGPTGRFTDPVLRASSGSPQLDASARRAVLAASGKVRRPAIIGTEPIPVILHVKYQYGLR